MNHESGESAEQAAGVVLSGSLLDGEFSHKLGVKSASLVKLPLGQQVGRSKVNRVDSNLIEPWSLSGSAE